MALISSEMGAPQMRVIDGLKIRFISNGKTDAKHHILLLSPWPESLFAFEPTWKKFSEIGYAVAVDLPGIGHSEGRSDVMSPEPMGEFIVTIAEAFEMKRPHIIGPDVGTSAGLYAAYNHPEAFSSLVIGSGAADHNKVGPGLGLLVNSPTVSAFADITGRGFVEAASKEMTYKVPPAVFEDFATAYEGPRFIDSVAFLRAYPTSLPILAKRLKDIHLPVLIISGRNDPFVLLPNGEMLAEGLPHARHEVFETSHFTWEDAADQYADLSARWILREHKNV